MQNETPHGIFKTSRDQGAETPSQPITTMSCNTQFRRALIARNNAAQAAKAANMAAIKAEEGLEKAAQVLVAKVFRGHKGRKEASWVQSAKDATEALAAIQAQDAQNAQAAQEAAAAIQAQAAQAKTAKESAVIELVDSDDEVPGPAIAKAPLPVPPAGGAAAVEEAGIDPDAAASAAEAAGADAAVIVWKEEMDLVAEMAQAAMLSALPEDMQDNDIVQALTLYVDANLVKQDEVKLTTEEQVLQLLGLTENKDGVSIKLPGNVLGIPLKEATGEQMNEWYRQVVKQAFKQTHESSGAKSNLKNNEMFIKVSDTQREIFKRWQNAQKGQLSISSKEKKLRRQQALEFIATAKPCNFIDPSKVSLWGSLSKKEIEERIWQDPFLKGLPSSKFKHHELVMAMQQRDKFIHDFNIQQGGIKKKRKPGPAAGGPAKKAATQEKGKEPMPPPEPAKNAATQGKGKEAMPPPVKGSNTIRQDAKEAWMAANGIGPEKLPSSKPKEAYGEQGPGKDRCVVCGLWFRNVPAHMKGHAPRERMLRTFTPAPGQSSQ